ncbi:hypothetical protein, partial [Polymorphobacter multimanifer]|uniref:hypothetical protein n=1 Tax=Polymorphobacter multimanifer TaxID=1070431 RepID=UPI001A9CA0F6
MPRRFAAASTRPSHARSKRSITGALRVSTSVAIGVAIGLVAPEMKASAALSSPLGLGLLSGLRAIAIYIHSDIVVLYKYCGYQGGQFFDRLG